MTQTNKTLISVRDLKAGYEQRTLMQNITFEVQKGEVFIIMGGSGCGKSTLLRILMGLKSPIEGKVSYNNIAFWPSNEERRNTIMRHAGVLFQGGALWSSMTLTENVSLPLQQYTSLSAEQIREQAELKLALAGLAGFGSYYPSEISGGMRKRAGLARALALDPEILFLDEPSAGLDPVSAMHLDKLILQLRDTLNTTFVVVTHELESLFCIADRALYLDAKSRTMAALGNPKQLLKDPQTPDVVMEFLTRGEHTSQFKEAL